MRRLLEARTNVGHHLLTAKLKQNSLANKSALWAVSQRGAISKLDAEGRRTRIGGPCGAKPRRIVVSGDDTIWLAASLDNHSWGLFQRLSTGWTLRRRSWGHAVIGGSPTGGAWMVERRELVRVEDGVVADRVAAPFEPICVSAGRDGSIWALGGRTRFGGHSVHRYESDAKSWRTLPEPAAAVRVAATADGAAWSISSHGQLWRLHPSGAGHFRECRLVPSCTNCLYSKQNRTYRDLAVDASGCVWLLSSAELGAQVVSRITDIAARSTDDFPISRIVSIAASVVIVS
ncbi:MAG: hypothetical protein WAU68_03845 [Vitreimonas sp.]